MFCGECGTLITPGEKFCSKCGTPVAENVQERFCGKCGSVITPGSKVCGNCGTVVDDETDNYNEEEQQYTYQHTTEMQTSYSQQNTIGSNRIFSTKIVNILVFIATIFVPISFFMPMLEIDLFSIKISTSIVDFMGGCNNIITLLKSKEFNLSNEVINTVSSNFSTVSVVFVIICIVWFVNCICAILNIKKQKTIYSGCTIVLSILLIIPSIALFMYIQSLSQSLSSALTNALSYLSYSSYSSNSSSLYGSLYGILNKYINLTSLLASGFYVYIIANIVTPILSVVGICLQNRK